MATKQRSLISSVSADRLPSAEQMRFGIVVAQWNDRITEKLLGGCVKTLRDNGCSEINIQVRFVPGSFELPLATQFFAEYTDVDAVIVLGCVVRGDTAHFDYVCQGTTQGIMRVQIDWNMPVAFGVLMTEDMEQAFDRAGGKYGNKGSEAAAAAIQMVRTQMEMAAAAENTSSSLVN